MTKIMRKNNALLVILTAFLLICCAGCGVMDGGDMVYRGGDDITEPAAYEAVTEKPEKTAAETMQETVTGTSAETEKAAEAEEAAEEEYDGEMPVIIPANELWENYPTKVIYPEETHSDITAKVMEISEEFRNEDGYTIIKFSASYPVFSGSGELDRINAEIKAFADEEYSGARKTFEDFDYSYYNPEVLDDIISNYHMVESYELLYGENMKYDYSVCGNILSVYFVSTGYSAGAAHGLSVPAILTFDLNTGERIDWNGLIDDKKAFDFMLMTAAEKYMNSFSYTYEQNKDLIGVSRYSTVDEWIEKTLAWQKEYGYSYDEQEGAAIITADGECKIDSLRLTVRNGCLCNYLASNERGSYADGIRCIEIPLEDAMPYMNGAGKALLESAPSAKSAPEDIIEYYGERYLAHMETEVSAADMELTAGDYAFIAMCPNVYTLYFTRCGNIDFEKIAAMKNITHLWLNDCEFDDISPLTDSGVIYIYGSGHNISKEQADAFTESRKGRYVDIDLIEDSE